MGESNFIKQIVLNIKWQTNTELVGDFNNPLLLIDRSSWEKLSREILELNDIIDQIDFKNVYRTFHPTTERYIFFPAAHGIFSKTDHISGHKGISTNTEKLE